MCFESGLRSMLVAVFLMYGGSEFQTEGPKYEKVIFCLLFIERKFQETGVSTGMKRPNRRTEMKDMRYKLEQQS